MKKISAKQLLVNAMQEYGYNLILENRIWPLAQPGPASLIHNRAIICAPPMEVMNMKMMKNLKKSMAQYGEMIAVIGHNIWSEKEYDVNKRAGHCAPARL